MSDAYEDSYDSYELSFDDYFQDKIENTKASEKPRIQRIPDNRMHETAKVKYDTLTLHVKKDFTLRDLYRRNKSGEIVPKNKGEFHLHFGHGLELEKFNPAHFTKEAQEIKGKDLTKSIKLTHLRTTLDAPILFECPTVPTLKTEGMTKSNCVSKKVLPTAFKPKEGLTLLERNITYANIAAHNEFPTENIDTFASVITKTEFGSLVKFDSSVVNYYNTDPANKGKLIKGPEKCFGDKNVCVMENSVAEKYFLEAKTDKTNKMPHGDVSRGFQVILSLDMPTNRVRAHEKFQETGGKEGRPWLGFADFGAHAEKFSLMESDAKSDKVTYDPILDKQETIEAILKLEYIHGDGKPIPFTL
jgi:hypothetical protein